MAGAIFWGASCTARRPPMPDPTCIPLSQPLTVVGGEVVIACVADPDEPAEWGPLFFIDCRIRPTGGDRQAKSGHFMLDQRGGVVVGFDATDASTYVSWDGCSTIHLRDGRELEEVTIISSHVSSPSDFRGDR